MNTQKMTAALNARWWATAILVWAVLVSAACAAELTAGDSVPTFSAKDQFGKDFRYSPGLHYLVLGFDRSAGQQATAKLAELGTEWLGQHSAAYVLDTHNMPAIARVFALPKMRKCPVRIILCDDAKTLATFPRKPEKITVLTLTADGKIKDIRYWDAVTEKIAAFLN